MEWLNPLISAGAALLGAFIGGWMTGRSQDRALEEQRKQRLNDVKREVYGRLVGELQHCICCVAAGLTYDPEARDFTGIGAQASLIASPEVMGRMSLATELCISCRQLAECGQTPTAELGEATRANADLLRAMQNELGLR